MALVLTGLMPFILLGLYACEIEETGALGLIGLAIAALVATSGAFTMKNGIGVIFPPGNF